MQPRLSYISKNFLLQYLHALPQRSFGGNKAPLKRVALNLGMLFYRASRPTQIPVFWKVFS